MKLSKLTLFVAALFVCISLVILSAPVQSAVTAEGPFLDTTTRGNWVGTYGECLYILPWPEEDFVENPLDPNVNVCVGGSLAGDITWDIFKTATDPVAFVWALTGPFSPLPGAEQWNPCEGDFVGATFDNDNWAHDPLVSELTLTYDGDLTVAYYFAEAANRCREEALNLIINGVPVANGVVNDLSSGKFMYFNISGLTGTSTIRLETTNTGNKTCALPTFLNTHLSGVFISSCLVEECGNEIVEPGETCDPPGSNSGLPNECRDDCTFCGDDIKQPGEDCDDGNNDNGDGCSADCTIESLGCRFTGGGVDTDLNWDHTLEDGEMIRNGSGNVPEGIDRAQFGGQAGANTALPPQPAGEWTHHQQKGPSGDFTFHCGTSSAPEGSEVIEIRCDDPDGCTPSGNPPSPVKQLDFDCIGTFKNIGKGAKKRPTFEIPDANATAEGKGNKTFDGTFHYAEINIDDLGERGGLNSGVPGSLECPDIGFGEKGEMDSANCECPDFYRITIYEGVNAADVTKDADGNINELGLLMSQPVIYEFYGYIDGGNLQIHRLTGFDR